MYLRAKKGHQLFMTRKKGEKLHHKNRLYLN